jgi:osmotically-inducible protein OsmY/NifU-like protein involved in Fe-S cluster formation
MGAAIAPIIPPAITQQIETDHDTFTDAIAPAMGQAIKKQVEIQQDAIVDALYPIIGGTISKYLAETVRHINQQVEEALSVRGIQRKIRSKLQGVSEAELILREAVPVNLQAIFLIHKASGIVIAESQALEARLESDMMAGMLTAIRSFANDCMSHTGNVSELNQIDYGTSKILLEVAGYCYLAIVIQGEPTPAFLSRMRQSLKTLVQQYGTTIEHYDGNADALPEKISGTLQTLLQSENTTQPQKKPPMLAILGSTLVALIATPIMLSLYRGHLQQQVETALDQTPELAIYKLQPIIHFGALELTGRLPNDPLRQKAEQIAHTVLPKWTIQNHISVVDVPADPVLAAAEVKRITQTLNQTPGVAIAATYQAEQVTLQGKIASHQTSLAIAQAYRRVPGIKSVISSLQIASSQLRLSFAMHSTALNSEQQQQLQIWIQQNPQQRFRITGYSNDSRLAQNRAIAVQQLLIQFGVARDRLQIRTIDPASPVNEDLQRSVLIEAD